MPRAQTILSLFLTTVMLLLAACHKAEPIAEQIPLVMVAQPQPNAAQLQSYAGDVQARQQSPLAFRVAGQITERLVDVGDRVVAGQVLARLDVKDAELQKNAARAQLDNAQSAAKVAATELARYQQLLPSNAVSRSQYDTVANQYQAAQAQLKQAQSNLAVANNQTQYNVLRANRAGVITQRSIEVGQVVAAGQAAYELALDGEREVVVGVPEQVVGQLKVNQAAQIILWSQPNTRLTGFIREIAPAAASNRTFTIKVALNRPSAQIQLGQSARVFLTSADATNTLHVPLSSISAVNQQPYVWVVNGNNTLRKVNVQLGVYGRDTVAVLSGLKASDWVVVGGVHLLRAQQKIQPIDRENRPVRVQTGAAI